MLALVEDRCFGGRSDLRLTASASFTLPALRPSHGYVAENACWEYEGHLIPCPRCALAEAQAKIETTERDNAFLAEGRDQAFRDRDALKVALGAFTPHGMNDVRALWANGQVCEECSHSLCVYYRGLLIDRDALQAKLEQAREVMSRVLARLREINMDGGEMGEWLGKALAALEAGKETGG